MVTRLLDWRDIPALLRYRKDCVYLNSAWLLTRGQLSFPSAMFSSLSLSNGVFTAISLPENGDNIPLIGQVMQTPVLHLAQLTFLMPEKAINRPLLNPLLEHLSAQLIERGILRILADIDEEAATYEILRQAGYAVYSRQRIWEIKSEEIQNNSSGAWQMAEDQDVIAIRSLYHNIVPPLVQQVESFPTDHTIGMVYKEKGEILGYIEPSYGYRGIWIQPLIHPDLEDLHQVLKEMISGLPYRLSRPVFICVRSYQSWLEPILEDFGAEAGPRQAVMVKHLAVAKRVVPAITIPTLDGGRAEISVPFVHSEKHNL